MIKFKSYPEMENHTRTKTINLVVELGHAADSVEWVAREKIHGTNFSLITNGIEFTAARRSGLLEPEDKFYDRYVIERRYANNIIKLYHNMVRLGYVTPAEQINVFGEYAGVMASGKWIQTGIDYGPQDFYPFDIMVLDAEGNVSRIIDDNVFEDLIRDVQMKPAPLLARGTFKEIMSIPVDLQSVVIDYAAGNPFEIKVGTTNIAEGYVAKPNVSTRFGNGSRIAIKCKNEKWSEVGSGKAVQAKIVEMTDDDKAIVTELVQYITENRLKNVISKIGTPELRDFGKVMGLMSRDIQKDFELDTSKDLKDTDDLSRVIRALNSDISAFIRPNWVDITDGNF